MDSSSLDPMLYVLQADAGLKSSFVGELLCPKLV